MTTLLETLSQCPHDSCCIEQMDYYRCTSCKRDFIVRSGELDCSIDPTKAEIIQAAWGWVGIVPS